MLRIERTNERKRDNDDDDDDDGCNVDKRAHWRTPFFMKNL